MRSFCQIYGYVLQSSSSGSVKFHLMITSWNLNIAVLSKIDKQQGCIVQHREIQPLSCNNFKWSIIDKILNYFAIHLKLM